ncbi:MAG: hypothetical protein JWO22_3605 [Frankiales bacterium]|nr:hypothetical protein [Frankiales bacterium]
MSWTRRLALSTGLALAAVGIAVPLSLSSSAASAAPPDAVTAAFQPAAFAGHAPQALKHDLKAAWKQADGKRVAALQAVLKKAVAGDYGTEVAARAQKLQTRLAGMDPTLRSDLLAAIDLPKSQRQAAFRAIRQKVRAGAYGAKAKRDAKLLKRARHHRLFG